MADHSFIPQERLSTQAIQRILVCQLRQIGDVLLATPSLQLLHERFPSAELHFYTEKKCLPIVEHNPHIHKVWAVDKQQLPSLWHELRFYRQVTQHGFDLVIDFQQLPRCRWVVAMSGAALRLSFTPPWYNRLLYTHWVQPQPAYAGAYKAQVLTPLGIHWQGERPRIYLSQQETEKAYRLLHEWQLLGDDKRFFISIDATHRHGTRCWPAEHYAALIDRLAMALPQSRFLLPYGPGEEEYVRGIYHRSSMQKRICIPPNMLKLRELAACMQFAALHIGNCSAPRHMAVALDVPSITVQGATKSGWTFPAPEHMSLKSSIACQGCNKNTCPYGHIHCLTKLLPEQVWQKVYDHLLHYGRIPN